MNISGDCNIYEFNARSVLEQFTLYIDGTPNDVVMVISTYPLSGQAQQAFEKSAERLGYGKNRIAYVCLQGVASDTDTQALLSASDLKAIITGIDPLALILADSASCTLLEEAYATSVITDKFQRINCKNVVAFDGFENMLASNDDKQRAWAILKNLSLG